MNWVTLNILIIGGEIMADTTKKNRRVRSPKYPSFNLERAIELATQLFEQEGLHKIPADVAVQDMGYTSSSSRGGRGLSALQQYGLLDAEGSGKDRHVWLSALGKDIVLERREVSAERDEAIKQAALMPSIYQQLFEEYGGDLPSDATIETLLLRKHNFNRKVLKKFIRGLRATFQFANLSKSEKEEIEESEDFPSSENKFRKPLMDNTTKSHSPTDTRLQDITIPLIGGGMAVLSVPIPLSKRNFDHLIKMIQTMSAALVSTDKDLEK